MKAILVMLAFAAGVHGADEWVNPSTQERGRPEQCGDWHNPTTAILYFGGWRILRDVDHAQAVSNGWQRVAVTLLQHPALASNAVEIATDIPIPPPDTNSVPVAVQAGIETPFVGLPSVPSALGWAQGVTDDGVEFWYRYKMSPYSEAVCESNRLAEAKIAKDIVKMLRDLRVPMTNSIRQAKLLKPTVFSGTQRAQMAAVQSNQLALARSQNKLRIRLLKFYKVAESEDEP